MLSAIDRASRMHRAAGDRAELLARFERALDTMWVAFQPIVSASDGALYGYEALMRSGEPSLAKPEDLLDAAERVGRTRDLGRRVRDLAAVAFERAPRGAVLFVNLHSLDLLDPALYQDDEPLGRFADRVVLEITERGAIRDVKDIRARVSVLRYHGYRIAIDDLGSGYAGLSSLVALEPEVVKLDMSLVRGAHQSAVQQRLIRSMTAFCGQSQVPVVAEGVETKEERDCIRDCGCSLVQGYLFAKPGPPFPVPAVIR
jgi:EAL domain-containing protein (putative c-di-GMP-specific phosphodiesterase class I)